MRRRAGGALKKLLAELNAGHIYLSYNSEGILSKADILELLAVYGTPKIWEIPYPVFGKGAGVSRKRKLTEYLFYIEKHRE
jgi:adenine-specific DNA-methyltransferase